MPTTRHDIDTSTSPLSAATITAASTRHRLAAMWWQVGAAIVSVAMTVVAIDIIANDPGPIWKRSIGFALLTTAVVLVVVGLVIRRGRAPVVGSAMVAVGVTPGIAPIVFFWFPPAVAFGLFSIAVLVFAANDAADAGRVVTGDRSSRG